jgi:RimJ/RimL family protein N-acetyltransferase
MEAHLAGEDEEQARRLGWWPKRSGPEQFRQMLADDQRDWTTGGSRRKFAARVAGTLVGGAEVRVVGEGLARISYWTFPQFRDQGLATRATRLVCAWAFEEFEIERIEACIQEDNLASRGVATGAGFCDTGRRNEEGLLVYELCE